MSMNHSKPDPDQGTSVPYPSWSAIAAEVGGVARRPDRAGETRDGKGWFDLLAEDNGSADLKKGRGSQS